MDAVRILVVEDDKNIMSIVVEIVDRLLSAATFPQEIIQTERGENAIDIINSYGVHIVITDIGLPDMSGAEVIKAVHGSGVVIAMSGHATTEEIEEAGPDFFLRKPFLTQEFSIVLIRALAAFFEPA